MKKICTLLFAITTLSITAQVITSPGFKYPLYFAPSTGQPSSGIGIDPTIYSTPGRSANFSFKFDPSFPNQSIINVCNAIIVPILNNTFDSPIPIVIEVKMATLSNWVLAQAGPTSLVQNVASAPGEPTAQPNTWYPIALAEKLSQIELNLNQPDITVEITSVLPTGYAWYFGTDGMTPNKSIDFITTLLHEVMHGLGFSGTARPLTQTTATWGPLPLIFDKFVEDGNGAPLISFPQTATAFSPFFFGSNNGVFFNGTAAKSQNSNNRVKLYASTLNPSSNIYHLNDVIYPNGSGSTPPNANALMNPVQTDGKAGTKQTIGNVIRAIMKDIGWSVSYIVGGTDFYSTFSNTNPTLITNGTTSLFNSNVYNYYPNSTITKSTWTIEAYHKGGKVLLSSSSFPGNVTSWPITNFTFPTGYDYARKMNGSVSALLTFSSTLKEGNNNYNRTATSYANMGIAKVPDTAYVSLNESDCSNGSMKIGLYSKGAQSYQIFYGLASSGTYQTTINVPSGQSEYEITGLALNKNYIFTTRGYNNAGYGTLSAQSTFIISCPIIPDRHRCFFRRLFAQKKG